MAGKNQTGSSNGGMGISKHRKSGKCPKSPKIRHALRREVEEQEVKSKDKTDYVETIDELFQE